MVFFENSIDFKSNSADYLTTPTGELADKLTQVSRARSVAKSNKSRLQFKQNKLLEETAAPANKNYNFLSDFLKN